MKVQPRLTHCDKCGKPNPPEVVEELRKAPRFHTCPRCSRECLIVNVGR